ncbi:MAG: hypothetical protein OFPI_33590 [Osedax symbiont Rs2]|nr:MAG: hypothetical protein OFPI_33590 [Osedax symbiont Rs2]
MKKQPIGCLLLCVDQRLNTFPVVQVFEKLNQTKIAPGFSSRDLSA